VSTAAFRAAAEKNEMPVLVHAAYLINLGSPTPHTYERSRVSLAHALRRGAAVGAAGVVVHTGSCVNAGSREAALVTGSARPVASRSSSRHPADRTPMPRTSSF
jgi:endonuclease IV